MAGSETPINPFAGGIESIIAGLEMGVLTPKEAEEALRAWKIQHITTLSRDELLAVQPTLLALTEAIKKGFVGLESSQPTPAITIENSVGEISSLETALDSLDVMILDPNFDPVAIQPQFGGHTPEQFLKARLDELQIILPALAESNGVQARRLIARAQTMNARLTSLVESQNKQRLEQAYHNHSLRPELELLMSQNISVLTPQEKLAMFNRLSELVDEFRTYFDFDNLAEGGKETILIAFLREAEKKIQSLSVELGKNALRDHQLEQARPELQRLWDLANSAELVGYPVYHRHETRAELENILIDLTLAQIGSQSDNTDQEAINELSTISVQLDAPIQRYANVAVSKIVGPVQKLEERLQDLKSRYQQVTHGVLGVEPVSVLQVSQLKEDLDYYSSIVRSRRLKAAIRPFNTSQFDALQSTISSVDLSDTFVDIVKIQELRTMSYENLARHCLSIGVDPFAFQTARSGTQQEYYAEVVRVVKERLFAPHPEDTPWKDHERKRWFNFLAMSILDNKGQYEAEVAATTKSAEVGEQYSLEAALSEHLITRDELIAVTTKDPEYGAYFASLIDGLKVQAALKPRPSNYPNNLPTPDLAKTQLLAMSPSELKKKNPIMTTMGQVALWKGSLYQYNPAFDYVALTNESSGRTAMRSFFTNHVPVPPNLATPEKQGVRDFVINFACRAYTGLTVLDESFYTLQASTQTRGHNAAHKGFGNLYLGIAAAVHNVFRYTSPRHPSVITHFPFKESSRPDFYFLSSQIRDEFTHSLKMARKRQHCFFDTRNCFEQLEYPGFLEFIFPESSSLFTLAPEEKMWVVHEDCIDMNKPVEITDASGVKKTAVSKGKFTHKLIDGTGKALAFRDAYSGIYSAAGIYVGKLEEAYEQASIDQIQASRSGKTEEAGTSRQKGFFTYANDPRLGALSNTRVVIGDAQIVNESGPDGKTGIKDEVTSRTLYYTALRGMEKVFNTIFSPVPGGLTATQIVEASGGKGTTLISEILGSFGMLKMFPNYAIDNLTGVYLTYYCHRLMQSFSNTDPKERTRLAKSIVEQITQTASYGGLSRKRLKEQIQIVIDSLLTIDRPEPGLDTSIWKPTRVTLWKGTADQKEVTAYPRKTIEYYKYTREKERVQYITDLWEEERPDEPLPPLGTTLKSSVRQAGKQQVKRVTGEGYSKPQLEAMHASQTGTKIPPYLDFQSTELKASTKEEKGK